MTAIRAAELSDISKMTDLIQRRRQGLESLQPVFWKPAPDARTKTESWFSQLVESDLSLCLVCKREGEILGFLIATETPSPPVYDPGGPTWVIDDFAVAEEILWETAGISLLQQAQDTLRQRGVRQIVVVSAVGEQSRNRVFEKAGLVATSLWSTKTL